MCSEAAGGFLLELELELELGHANVALGQIIVERDIRIGQETQCSRPHAFANAPAERYFAACQADRDAVQSSGRERHASGVAHLAHQGGLAGKFLLMRYWKKGVYIEGESS